MARLKSLQRYSLVLPTKAVRAPKAASFRAGARQTIQSFMAEKHPEMLRALQWLLFREWVPGKAKGPWTVPVCPNCGTEAGGRYFESGGPIVNTCESCGEDIYFTDSLRLYERIDEEQGAGGILAYLLSTLEQLVIVHVIRSILEMKPAALREVLLIRDGPLAFFGVVAPLKKPMMELMAYLAEKDNGRPLICLVGLEKGGHFVEHAALVAPELKPNHLPDDGQRVRLQVRAAGGSERIAVREQYVLRRKVDLQERARGCVRRDDPDEGILECAGDRGSAQCARDIERDRRAALRDV